MLTLEDHLIQDKLVRLAQGYPGPTSQQLFVEYHLQHTGDPVIGIPVPPYEHCIRTFRPRTIPEERLTFLSPAEETLFFTAYAQLLSPRVQSQFRPQPSRNYLLGLRFLDDLLSILPESDRPAPPASDVDAAILDALQRLRHPASARALPSFQVSRRRLAYSVGALALAGMFVLGGWAGVTLHQRFSDEQAQKMVRYRQQFAHVQQHLQRGEVDKAQDLSKDLQRKLKEEWFFAPSKKLLDNVKEYDETAVRPQVRKRFLQQQYQKLEQATDSVKQGLSSLWDKVPRYRGEKIRWSDHPYLFFLTGGFLLYALFRKRRS